MAAATSWTQEASGALFAWLKKVVGDDIQGETFSKSLQNGRVLDGIVTKIEQMSEQEKPKEPASLVLHRVGRQAMEILRKNNASGVPSSLEGHVDTKKASEGDEEALINLTSLVLAAAMSSETSRDDHIEHITTLNEKYQETLMNIIQNYLGDDMGGGDDAGTHHRRQSSSFQSDETFSDHDDAYQSKDKVKKLQSKIEQLELDKVRTARNKERLKCEVNEDSEHPGQHSSDEGFSNHVQELLDQLQKHQQEITRLRNEGGQERDKLKEQLQSVQDERDLYKSKVRSLERIEAEKEQYRQRAEDKQGKVDQLELQLKEQKEQLDSVSSSQKHLQSEVSAKDEKLFEVSKQLSQIKGERTSLSEEVDRLRQSEKQINQEKRYLEEQLEAARSGRGGENDPSTVEEINHLKEQLRKVREERDELKNEADSARTDSSTEISRLKAEVEALLSRLKEKETAISALKEQVQATATRSSESSHKDELVKSLRTKLGQKEEDLKDLQAIKDERMELTRKINELEEAIQNKDDQINVQRQRTQDAMGRSEKAQTLIGATLFKVGDQFLRSKLLSKRSSSHLSKGESVSSPLQSQRTEVRRQIFNQANEGE